MLVRSRVVLSAAATLLLLAPTAALADSTGSVTTDLGTRPEARPAQDLGSVSAASPAGFAGTDRPEPILPERVRGRAAVKALGSRLPAVAARNGLTAPKLERLLSEDETAWVSQEGQVYFQEELPAEVTAESTPATAMAAAYPSSRTFALHSRPGAARTIFLDFDGAKVSGTGWAKMIKDGTHVGWSADGSPATFTAGERAWIQEVWRQVAETYAPFDVDVTTADPGTAGVRRSTSTDTRYGTHVLITGSTTAVAQACDSRCLGVAYIGTFENIDPRGYTQPAWVFADRSLSATTVAQAASHEAGHTLGLQHDGKGSADYYAGTHAWGPIMGSASFRAVSQFSRGEYTGANNLEDDFAVMRAHGLPPRTDDHGSSTAAARQLGAFSAYDVGGVVETRTDTDVFAIDRSCATDLTVAATGIGAQAALDLSLEILDSTGTRVDYASPASSYNRSLVSTGMDAQLTVPAGPGTYYLRVDGVGHGNPATDGWSDYGSIGQYRLTATGCADAPAPLPVEDPVVVPPAAGSPETGPTPPEPTPVAKRPGAPVIRAGTSGRRGGAVTAVARWAVPTTTGGASITRYRAVAQRLNSRNRVIRTHYSGYKGAGTRSITWRLPRGRYVFKVMAWNRVGASSWSKASRGVYAR